MKDFLKRKLDKIEKELSELEIKKELKWAEYLETLSAEVDGELTFIKNELEFLRGQRIAYELVGIELETTSNVRELVCND